MDRKVAYKISTEGSYKSSGASPSGSSYIFANAFALATQNLLADRGFYKLVSYSKSSTTTKIRKQIKINRISKYATLIKNHANDVRGAIVTVFAGDGHGSGFFVNKDGLLITNYHVVKEARSVKIKLATGKEILGEVVRRDSRRDIALIRSEEKNTFALPIRMSDIKYGEEIFAFGTTLDETLSTTITKGIVSGFRDRDGMKFIQSDVNVLRGNSGGPLTDIYGNVVGVTVEGVLFSGSPSGVNFFIPIKDSLKILNIKIDN